MLGIVSAIFGFAAPFLPELLKAWNRKQDNAHELAMMDMRLRAGAAEHTWWMEEITAKADIEEARTLHTPAPSFGVQVLDAARNSGFGAWAIVPAFYLFTVLDFVAGMVRPVVAYAAFGFYIAYKWALYRTYTGPRFESSAESAIIMLWGEQDWAVLTLVLSYWFGHRAAKAAFGGNATSGKPGA